MSAFKRPAAQNILQTASAMQVKPTKSKKQETKRVSKRAQVMFTEEEYAKLNVKRGGVPLSAYLRSKLKETGEI